MINEPTLEVQDIVRPTHVEENLTQLTANYEAIQARVGAGAIMPVLKSNAYGHGLVTVAQHLQTLNVPYLGVAFLEEGIMLRSAVSRPPSWSWAASSATRFPSFCNMV